MTYSAVTRARDLDAVCEVATTARAGSNDVSLEVHTHRLPTHREYVAKFADVEEEATERRRGALVCR